MLKLTQPDYYIIQYFVIRFTVRIHTFGVHVHESLLSVLFILAMEQENGSRVYNSKLAMQQQGKAPGIDSCCSLLEITAPLFPFESCQFR